MTTTGALPTGAHTTSGTELSRGMQVPDLIEGSAPMPLRRMAPRDNREVLVVRSGLVDDGVVVQELSARGATVTACGGPGSGPCPLMQGRGCELRDEADVALVYLDPRGMWPGSGTLPRIRCAADPSSPALVVLIGSSSPASIEGRHATIGELCGASAIADALDLVWQAGGS